MKYSVCIPVYDGKVPVHLVNCLLAEKSIARELGDEMTVRFLSSCTNLAMGRNQLVKEFLESGDEKLVFIDADVTFPLGSVAKLVHYPVDFVAGAYRLKRDEEEYPVAFLDNEELWSDKYGLLEVAMVPTGFMCLSRNVFEEFRKKIPNREYDSRGKPSFAYFQIPYRDGALYTEDSYFCREWKEIGGKIHLAPEITLVHWDGNIPYVGSIGKWLRSRATERKAV